MSNDLKFRISLKGMAAVLAAFKTLKFKARDLAKSMGRAFSRVARSVRTLGRHLRRLGVVFAGLIGLSIKNAATYETLKLRLKTVTGSAKEAEKVFNSLFKLSIKTQFTPRQLIEGAILLRAFGQEGEKSILAVAEAAAAMGKPIKDVAAVIGSLETEPLRRLGIEFEKVGTKGTATFRDKFGKEMERSADGIDNLRKMLLEVFSIKFGGTLVEASRTVTGLLSTLKGNVEAAFATVGAQISPVFKAFLDKLNVILTKAFKEGGPLEKLGAKLAEFGIQFSAAVLTMGQSMESFRNVVSDIADVIQTAMVVGMLKAVEVLKIGFKNSGIILLEMFGRALGRMFLAPGQRSHAQTAGAQAVKDLDAALARLLKEIKPMAERLKDNVDAIKDEVAQRKKASGAGEAGGDVLGGGGGEQTITSIGLGDLRKKRIRFGRLGARKRGMGFRTTSDSEVNGFGGSGSMRARAQARVAGLGLGRPVGFIPPQITEATKKAQGFVPGMNFGQQIPVLPEKKYLTAKQLETKALKQIARNTGVLASKVGVVGGATSGGSPAGSGGGGGASGSF